jgi:hypothetical protein
MHSTSPHIILRPGTIGAVLLALAVGFVLAVRPASAASQRCFPQTGFCISGPIGAYWQQHGGLPVFGYPISDQHVETVEGSWTGPVQWFERDRLEDHTTDSQGVLAGRLGVRSLELQGRPWVIGNDGPRHGRAFCRTFDQTGYNVCAPFSFYWEHNGGLERFGYPITPAIEETIEDRVYLVQYFERRRMEYHPENQPPNDLLLGLLGREAYTRAGGDSTNCPIVSPILHHTWEVYARDLGCPGAYVGVSEGIGIATQPFERGAMLWLPRPDGGPGHIFAMIRRPDGSYTMAALS